MKCSLITDDLVLDLDADKGVVKDGDNRISSWKNQQEFKGVRYFVDQDSLRSAIVADPNRHSWGYLAPLDEKGIACDTNPTASGKPKLVEDIAEIKGHGAIEFRHDELHNEDANAFDGFHTSQGYTWFVLIKVDKNQLHPSIENGGTPNAFFGNLQNTANPKPHEGKCFAGFFGGILENYGIYGTSRNGLSFDSSLDTPRLKASMNSGWNIVAFRQGAGNEGDDVNLDIFVNGVASPEASCPYRIDNSQSHGGIMAIGQERHAINHMGTEAFRGQIARFLIYKKPLNSTELKETYKYLKNLYVS